MTSRPVIALVIGVGKRKDADQESIGTLSTSLVLLRAVLDRSGRVLLAAEAAHLVPLLMAAAEYEISREVEGQGENVPAPIILGPMLATDSVEEQILRHRPEGTEDDVASSLLDVLLTGNLVDSNSVRESNNGRRRSFQDLLEDHRPRCIIAVGGSSTMPDLLAVAEDYQERAASRAQLLRVQPREPNGEVLSRWKQVEYPLEGGDIPPPRLDGEILSAYSEQRQWDEALLAMALEVAREVAWTLELDRLIAEALEA